MGRKLTGLTPKPSTLYQRRWRARRLLSSSDPAIADRIGDRLIELWRSAPLGARLSFLSQLTEAWQYDRSGPRQQVTLEVVQIGWEESDRMHRSGRWSRGRLPESYVLVKMKVFNL
jgi:hypothetical protein